MAMKKRFKKKDIEIKSLRDKDEKKELAKLTLLKSDIKDKTDYASHTVVDLNEIKRFSTESGSDSENYQRKLICYKKINELFQSNSLSLFNLMKASVEIICTGVDAEGGSLWVSEENIIQCRVAIGPNAKKLMGKKMEYGQGILGWVAQNNKSQVIYDTSLDERFQNNSSAKSLMATPMAYENKVIGLIEVINKKDENGQFSDSDLNFIEHISTLLGMYIKTTRVLREQDSLIKRMSNFADLHEKFSSTIELDELLVLVLQRAINFLEAEVGSIWLVEDHGEGIECSYAVGPTKDKVQGLKLRRGVGLIGKVIDDKESVIVEDCSKDKNFSTAVDSQTNFISRTMVSAPFVVKGECIGAIQILNKKGDRYFGSEDLELLNLFGSAAGMYLKNARLYQSEKKAKDFSALIDIGKQITSTLDLDSVLLTIVNLSSKVVPFDEAQISTKKIGTSDKMRLRAITGQQEVEMDDLKNQQLQYIHNILIQKDIESIYVENLKEIDDSHPIELKNYMIEHELNSLWIKVLKDDQGCVGVFSIEAEEGYLVSAERKEIMEILTSQSTVALRNVELYNTIPSSQFVKNVKESALHKITHIKEIKGQTWAYGGGVLILSLLMLFFVKVPNNISTKIEILPLQQTFFSQVQGVVKQIHITEGDRVEAGDLLAELDIDDIQIQLLDKESKKQKAKTEMFKFREEGNIADFKIKEAEYISLDYEIELMNKKVERSKIYSRYAGVVISENMDELIGKPVNFGDEIVKVGSLERVIVKFEVPEGDVQFIRPNQDVKFKVYGSPNHSYSEGIKIRSIGGEGRQVLETDPNKFYMAKAEILLKDNKGLKPGMSGRGKIYSDWIPVGQFLLGPLYNFFLMEILF